ncbi:MAG: hypothetical protein JWR27_1662 [Aeromicrobium sp.]|nr:hypothetical protein [Aeromicrobium sp.]
MEQVAQLTRRESATLDAVARRLTNGEIASEFHVSVRTVESHIASLRRKLGAGSRMDLIAAAQSQRTGSRRPWTRRILPARAAGRRPERDDQGMWIGWVELYLLLGDVHSLKQKRSVVRPLVTDLRRTFMVSAAETGSLDLHRRAGLGVSLVAADSQHVIDVLDKVEDYVARRPELDLLSARRRIANSDDE